MAARCSLHAMLLCLLLCLALLPPGLVQAQQQDCGEQRALDHAFVSGASWSMCLSVDPSEGLSLHSLSYRAPGDTLRSILTELHQSQILLHYHDSPSPSPQLTPGNADAADDLQSVLLGLNEDNCEGTLLDVSGQAAVVCSRVTEPRLLSRYAQRAPIHASALELSSTLQRGTLTWTTRIRLGEDGTIRPALVLSGRASRTSTAAEHAQSLPIETAPLVRATVMGTWRMVFDMDTMAGDRAEQFDFVLDTGSGYRRPLQVTALERESWLQVDREAFRGWRVVDASGAGYYLDPANNGLAYSYPEMGWTEHDAAVSRYRDCERHAESNVLQGSTTDPSENSEPLPVATEAGCGRSLDDFIDDESLSGEPIVFWYSLSRTLTPTIEDWPVLRDRILEFELLPFDWTAASPFESQ